MSLAALLQAVRDELRTVMGLPMIQIEVQEDGQPPPGMGGDLYLSVHPLSWRPTSGAEVVLGIDESYSVGVTITKRIRHTPPDRIGREVYLKSLIGFEAIARKIMVAIHQSETVMERANQYIAASQTDDNGYDPILEWLRWSSTQEVPTRRDGSWLWETNLELASETVTIVFSEARRIQQSSLME